MVDALREARRVLTFQGVLINLRPTIGPMVLEVVADARAIWVTQVDACNTPGDVVAAEAAVQHAMSGEWFSFEQTVRFDLDIYCDRVADLRLYAQTRKLREAEIPYDQLEQQERELAAVGQQPLLRCHRPWMLRTYRKK